MKKFRDTLVKIMTTVFGYGIMICLLVGGLSFFGYLAALIIGGETAELICQVIYKKIYPVLVLLSTSMIVLGLIKMYICKESAFKGGSGKRKPEHADN
ncbi:MAG: hypothetical protein IJL97_02165 [Lachnospiraceae bacterium]|nr:hypothetical protein [Lachnospiraceae bacterium]MCR5790246.1 hypothetical protein [Lachnospiraceae bacterium]